MKQFNHQNKISLVKFSYSISDQKYILLLMSTAVFSYVFHYELSHWIKNWRHQDQENLSSGIYYQITLAYMRQVENEHQGGFLLISGKFIKNV